jgi:fructosamine-3-kinase
MPARLNVSQTGFDCLIVDVFNIPTFTLLHFYTTYFTMLQALLGEPILATRALRGGDISEVHWVKTSQREVVVKVNRDPELPGLLAAEQRGLVALANSNTIGVPEVYDYQQNESGEYLVMAYIPNRPTQAKDYVQLAEQLAALHQQSAPHFGLEEANYIGRLAQKNTPDTDWPTFYTQLRLWPQLRLAQDQQLLAKLPAESRLTAVCTELLGHPSPSPLHGDLWGGNYLIHDDGTPYLIDPSFYYGHREVDLAMSRLFGGFGPIFYQTYAEIFPPEPGAEARQDLYQLYYLLVHLNMFGASYRAGVVRLLEKYFY